MTTDITIHKINACKFDYEFMGKSISQLASLYGFTERQIEEEIEDSGWVRRIEPTQLPDTDDMQKFADELESITRSKLSIIGLFRQIDNQPMIAQLEKMFLEKALEIGASLNTVDDRSTTKLMNLVKAVQMLQDRNPIDLADMVKENLKGAQTGIVVQIANHVN